MTKREKFAKFFKTKTARGITVAVAMVLIGLAVYLNYRWFYDPQDSVGYGKNNMEDNYKDNKTQTSAEDKNENNYFTATALTRTQSRDEALDVLKTITESAEASEEAKAEAQKQISRIATDIQNEANIESLVKAKGYAECVAIIGDDSVSVIVSAEKMQAADAAKILSIVCETTGINPEKVSIINR